VCLKKRMDYARWQGCLYRFIRAQLPGIEALRKDGSLASSVRLTIAVFGSDI
jgi:hypothetical protein